jgi:hypothetical protein
MKAITSLKLVGTITMLEELEKRLGNLKGKLKDTLNEVFECCFEE